MTWLLVLVASVVVLVVVAVVISSSASASEPITASWAASIKSESDGKDIRYIETRLATDWGAPSRLERMITTANRDYLPHFQALEKWWVEILDGEPWREIGFDGGGRAILAGPSERVYGFWVDTNMTMQDFQAQDPALIEISESDFEAAWSRFFSAAS